MTPLLAIDGHAVSGKSTLATIVAHRLGGTVVRPFDEEKAARLLGYAAQNRFDELERDTCAILRDAEGSAVRRPAVFDRHWLTVLVHLPDGYAEHWRHRSPTYLCWCDLETTLARLCARVAHEPDREAHAWFVARYRELAERLGVPLIDTVRLDPARAADLVVADLRHTS